MKRSGWIVSLGLLAATACHDTVVKAGGFSIAVSPKFLTFQRLDTTHIVAEILNVDGDTVGGHQLLYDPQDPTVLSVTAYGHIQSLGPVGTTLIFLRDPPDNLVDTVYATVTTNPIGIRLVPLDTAIGAFGRIEYSAVAWDTSGIIPRQSFTLSFNPDSGYLLDSADVVVKGNGRRGEIAVVAHAGSVQGIAAVTIADTLTAGRILAPGHPRWVAVSGTGQSFVSRPGAEFVTRYNAGAGTTEASLIAPFGASALALDSAASRLYLAGFSSILGFDASSGIIVDTFSTASQPLGVTVGPGGQTLWASIVGNVLVRFDRIAKGPGVYVSAPSMTRFAPSSAGDSMLYGMTSGAVIEINVVSDSLGRTFGGGGSLTDFVVTADRKTLFTSDAGKQRVTVWSLTSGAVVDSILLGAAPQGLALSSDGAQLWVTVPALGEVLVYDPVTRVLSKTVTLHGRPMGVGVGPTGTVALVANDSGWVDVVPR